MKTSLYQNVRKRLVIVFVLAFSFRLLLFIYISGNPLVIFQPDSRMYSGLAEGLLEKGELKYLHGSGPDVERLPGYPLFLALILAMSGGSYLAVAFCQTILDSLSCLLVALIGDRVWSGAGFVSGILAAINLNMITYSFFILNDSLFLFLFLLSLLLICFYFERPSMKSIFGVGLALGLATLVRPVLFYFPIFLIPFIFIHNIFGQKISWVRNFATVLILGCAFAMLLIPWLTRNYLQGGRFQLTAQAGEHIAQYVVPFVWQYSKGIPFIEGMKEVNRRKAVIAEQEGFTWKELGQFERSDRQARMGLEILKSEPLGAVAKAWLFGMAKNVFAPAWIDFSYLLGIERPHFFYTEGKTLLDRGVNFLRGLKGWFGWAVLGSILLMPLVRLVQLWGLILLMKKRFWEGALFCAIIAYFLMISGPVGYAKYRLPFEPLLIILLSISLLRFIHKLSSWKKGRSYQ